MKTLALLALTTSLAGAPVPQGAVLGYVHLRPGFEGWISRMFSPSRALAKAGYIVVRETVVDGPTPNDLVQFYRVRDPNTGKYLGYLTVPDARRLSRGDTTVLMVTPMADRVEIPEPKPDRRLPRATVEVIQSL